MKLALHLPINQVSFGQTSTLLLRTLFDMDQAGKLPVDLCVFPIGPVDLSCQVVSQEFVNWLQAKLNKAFESHSKDTPVFKLWHLNSSLESYSCKQTLFTFYELDNPTKIELNIARNSKLCLASKYALDVFKMFGVNGYHLPLAFDSYNFKVIDKKYHTDDRIVFNMCGKLERRKHHAKMLQSWIKKYGNNRKYALQCATYNIFLGPNPQECDKNNNELIRQIIGNDKPFNVSFLPFMRENVVYNDFLNSGDIVLGMSMGEGWDLPCFQSVALGKHAVLLKAHAYKTWATEDMVTFVQPNGKIPIYDNMFFKQGEPYNQGNGFDWSEEEFIDGCEIAIKKVQQDKINHVGLKLQDSYTKENFANNVLQLCGS